MDVLAVLVLLLSLARHSDAAYCVCNSGVSDSVLQKNIDYACGAGADCTAIQQNGACFNPNTIKDHCSYAVNSYYQRKGQTQGSCDFQGTATVTPNPPSAGSGCVYQSNPSTGGTNTPTVGGTPTSPGTPTTPSIGGTPTSPTVGGTPTSPNAGGSTTPGSIPGTPTNPGFGSLGPSGSGFSSPDNSYASPTLLSQISWLTLLLISAALIASNVMC